jgi:hypothetical protein
MLDLLPLIREQLLWDWIARGAPPRELQCCEPCLPTRRGQTGTAERQWDMTSNSADGWQIRPYSLNTGDQYNRLPDAPPS